MAGFDPQQIKLFVQNWFGEDKQTSTKMLSGLDKSSHKGIWELAETPLLLMLLCIAYRQTGQFPTQRHVMYRQAVELLLTLWDESRGIQRTSHFQDLTLGGKEKMLAAVAHEMFEDGQYLIHREVLNQKIRFYFSSMFEKKLEEKEVERIIAEIEAQHGIWVQQAQNIFSFAHLTLQEYFAAQYIVKNQAHGTVEQLMNHVGDDEWREVFLLVAEMLGDATKFYPAYLQATAKLIKQDSTLQQLIQWVAIRDKIGRSSVRPPARRAFLIGLACNVDLNIAAADRDLAPDLATDLDRTLIRARTHTRTLASTRTLSLLYALNPTLARACDRIIARSLDIVRVLLLDLAVMEDLSLLGHWPETLPDLLIYLQQCSQQLELADLNTHLQSLQLPGENEPIAKWQAFNAQLEQIILAHWGLEQVWDLSLKQVRLLEKYLQANLLLVECLGLATVPDREAIENQMLLVE